MIISTRQRHRDNTLAKLKSKVFYQLLNSKLHCSSQSGTKRWSKTCPTVKDSWSEFLKVVPKLSKENKIREFQFKFLYPIVVTKKELGIGMA